MGTLLTGIKVRRIWSWPQADDLNARGVLADTVHAAVAELLLALDKPLEPPTYIGPAGSKGRLV